MSIKGVIFDLDGTIIDSAWVWNKIDEEFLGARGIEVPDDYVEAIAHLGFEASAKYTIDRFGFDDKPEDLMEIWADMAMKEYRENVKTKPYAKEYLIKLKEKGFKLGVATASYKELFMPCLENNGIAHLFDEFATIAETGKPKDTPDVYLLAAKKLGLSSDECAVFEDLPQGIIAAKSAGFLTCGVPDSFTTKDVSIIEENADFTIFDYKMLIENDIF